MSKTTGKVTKSFYIKSNDITKVREIVNKIQIKTNKKYTITKVTDPLKLQGILSGNPRSQPLT